MKLKPIIYLLILILNSNLGLANNGERAVAYPVENLQIDGNLSDWPENASKYTISRSQNRFSPTDKSDFSAYFQVGYNLKEESIYIAVTVTDDLHVIESDTYSTHLNQDAHLLYLDLQHSLEGSGVAMYALTNNSLRLVNNHLSWDNSIKEGSINSITHAVKRNRQITIYEWKIYLGKLLNVNSIIGIDHVIVDMDDDKKWEYSTMAWGSNGWKSSMQNNLGDLLISTPSAGKGKIKGLVGWENKKVSAIPWGIQFISKENPSFWTQLPLRGNPEFKISLPPGEYEIRMSLASTADSTGQFLKVNQLYPQTFRVKENKTTDISKILFKTILQPKFQINEKGFLIDFDEKKVNQLDGFIKQLMNYYNIPGLSLACIQKDSLLYLKNYGTKNYYTKEVVSDETLFDVGSVTKTIFALTDLRLAELEQFDLDKPLYQYLPYPDLSHDERYKQLTGRHVLSHQTGLPNWRNGKLNFINSPGEKFGYSGEGFEYLKKVIIKVTGEEIESTIKRLVVNPMGIEKAYFTSNSDLLKNLSFGHYDLNIQIHAPEKETFVAFGMHSNAKYFTPFIIGVLNNNILEQGTYDEMLAEQVSIPTNWPYESTGWDQGYGLGFQLKQSPYGLVFGHGGRNGGFDCNYEIYKDLEIAYVFFTNSSSGHLIKNLIREYLITGNIKN